MRRVSKTSGSPCARIVRTRRERSNHVVPATHSLSRNSWCLYRSGEARVAPIDRPWRVGVQGRASRFRGCAARLAHTCTPGRCDTPRPMQRRLCARRVVLGHSNLRLGSIASGGNLGGLMRNETWELWVDVLLFKSILLLLLLQKINGQ